MKKLTFEEQYAVRNLLRQVKRAKDIEGKDVVNSSAKVFYLDAILTDVKDLQSALAKIEIL